MQKFPENITFCWQFLVQVLLLITTEGIVLKESKPCICVHAKIERIETFLLKESSISVAARILFGNSVTKFLTLPHIK